MAFPKKRNAQGRSAKELVGDLGGTYFSYIKQKARERDLEFSVSKEYLWDLFVKQNKKCALSGVDLVMSSSINKNNNLDRTNHTASLDRIDNAVGYVEGNLQWVHKQINRIRRELTIDEFLFWCNKVVHHVNSEPSSANDIKVAEKVQRLESEESTNNLSTSAEHPVMDDDIV